MIHVGIPSNFQDDSFFSILELTETLSGLPLKIILFHALEMPTSITELLLLPRDSKASNLVSAGFTRQCHQLVQELEQVQSIESVSFYGSTQMVFNSFLKAHKIEVLVVPTDFQHQAISAYSQNPISFIEKAKLPILSVSPVVPQLS